MPFNDGLLKISGLDAKKLLQGQLTCDLEKITDYNDSLAAHCNPQGRVISLFRIFRHQDAYYLFMQKRLVPIALAALKKYAVFYKVELQDASGELDDIRSSRSLTPYADLAEGIPAIYPETSGMFLPHDINLPALQAVDFDKGCYTGQEIIARMHYRGKPKNHLYLAKIVCEIAPRPGEDIYCNDQQIAGTVADVAKLSDDSYQVLIVTDSNHAKNQYLYLKSSSQHFFEIKNN